MRTPPLVVPTYSPQAICPPKLPTATRHLATAIHDRATQTAPRPHRLLAATLGVAYPQIAQAGVGLLEASLAISVSAAVLQVIGAMVLAGASAFAITYHLLTEVPEWKARLDSALHYLATAKGPRQLPHSNVLAMTPQQTYVFMASHFDDVTKDWFLIRGFEHSVSTTRGYCLFDNLQAPGARAVGLYYRAYLLIHEWRKNPKGIPNDQIMYVLEPLKLGGFRDIMRSLCKKLPAKKCIPTQALIADIKLRIDGGMLKSAAYMFLNNMERFSPEQALEIIDHLATLQGNTEQRIITSDTLLFIYARINRAYLTPEDFSSFRNRIHPESRLTWELWDKMFEEDPSRVAMVS